jgi:AcrR family transcriptional regulator
MSVTSQRRVARRRRLARPEREREILTVADGLFAHEGFGAVTMDQVAAQAGVTKPLLYAYFGNKDALYIACMRPAGEAMVATVAQAVQAADSPPQALRAGVRAFFEFVDDDRDAWRVLFDETLPAGGEIARIAGEYRERLTAMIAASYLARLPARTRARAALETEAIATALLGACEALARWWLHAPKMTSQEAADMLIATVEPGLRKPARATARP